MEEPLNVAGPAQVYRHDHPRIRSVNAEFEQQMSFGQRIADRVAVVVGSWPFIIVQSTLLAGWMAVNVYLLAIEHAHPGSLKAWDPYPFILLNLVLSFQAAYTGPVVMMSQNRQAVKDRLMAQSDFEVNQKAEEEIQVIMRHLVHQDRLLLDAIARVEAMGSTAATADLVPKLEALLQRMELSDRRVLAVLARLSPSAPEA